MGMRSSKLDGLVTLFARGRQVAPVAFGSMKDIFVQFINATLRLLLSARLSKKRKTTRGCKHGALRALKLSNLDSTHLY